MKVLVNYACFHRRNDAKRNSYFGNKTLNGHYLNNCISVHPKLAALCLLNLKVLPNKKIMRFYRRKQNSRLVSPPRLVTSNYRKATSLRHFLLNLKNSKTFNTVKFRK